MNAFHKTKYLNNTVVYKELLKQLKTDRITPVIGAGLSVWAGYLLWGKLIENLAEGADCEKEVEDCLSRKEYEKAASLLEDFYGHNYLMGTLIGEFSPEKLDESKRPPYQKLLPQLFKGPFVTTNFDVSLERLLNAPFVVNPQNKFHKEETIDRIQSNKPFLVKLHGTVDDSQHMVFTKKSYDSAYGEDEENPDKNKPLPQQLETIFHAAPPLFLGCSLGSDRTCRVFEKCSGATGFALLGTPDTKSEEFNNRRKKLNDMGIKVIWYPKGCHDAVEVLIRQLATDMGIDPDMPVIDKKMTLQEQQYKNSTPILGRDGIVEKICKYMNDPDIPAVIVKGLPGIGKTAICKAVYWKLKKAIPDFSMPFIDVSGFDVDDVITGIAKALEIKEDVSQEPTVDDLYSFLIEKFQEKDKKCYVYLDNFEDVLNNAETKQQYVLVNLLRRLTDAGLKLLISSQTPFILGTPVPIGTLDKNIEKMSFRELLKTDSGQLFLNTLGRDLEPYEQNDFVELMKEMNGHPLSIVLTATYCKGEEASITDVKNNWSTIQFPVSFDGRDKHKSLLSSLDLLWRQVKKEKVSIFVVALHTYSICPLDDDMVLKLNELAGNRFLQTDLQSGRRILRKYGFIDMMEDGKAYMSLHIKKFLEALADTEDCKEGTEMALSAWVTWCCQLLEPGNNSNFNKELYLLKQCDSIANQCQKKGKIDELLTLIRCRNKYQFNPDMNLSNKDVWTLFTLPF